MADISTLTGIALITGAATGIGKETAFAFAEAGCSGIVFADINYEGAQAAAEESKQYALSPAYRAIAIKVDVAEWQSVQELVDATVKEFGRIDYSINSAGIGSGMNNPVSQLDLEHFNRVVEVNFKGIVHCVSAVTKAMVTQEPTTHTPRSSRHPPRSIGRGVIINLGSVNSFMSNPGRIAYTSVKHGVIGVTKSAASDHARDHIRINAICPGATDTPMMRALLERVPEMGKMIEQHMPLWPRMACIDEVVSAIVYLCSPGASYITGTSLLIDAGMSLSSARM